MRKFVAGQPRKFVTPASDLRVLGMGIREVVPASLIHRPIGVEGFFLTFFYTSAVAHLHGSEQQIPPASLVIWESGRRQYFGNAHAEWEYSWLHCTGAWFLEQFTTLAIPINTVLTFDGMLETDQCLHALHQERLHDPALDSPVVQQILALWFALMRRRLTTPSLSEQIPPEWLASRQYLNEHFTDTVNLALLADKMCVTPQHFCRMFKRYFQVPPIDYMIRLRLEHARFLLFDHNLSIEEIALRVGYDDYRAFSALFTRRFGMRPNHMRRRLSGEEARERLIAVRRGQEFSRWTHEDWVPVADMDYSQGAQVEDDWHVYHYREFGHDRLQQYPVPQLAEVTDGALHLHASRTPDWTALRLNRDISEDVKIAVRIKNTPPDGPNLAVALSGDLLTGNRLRIFGYQQIDLETIRQGYWQVLQRCTVQLDTTADSYTVVIWRSDNAFYAEVDGERVMTYHEPFAAYGPAHRTVGLGRTLQFGDAQIERVQLWTRRSPRFVDILEPGRVLLRQCHHDDALNWFRRIANEHHETNIQFEATYLGALAIPDASWTAKEAALRQVVAEADSPFRSRALRELTLQYMAHHDLTGAVDSALHLHALTPDVSLIEHLVQNVISQLRTADGAEQRLLAYIARLPVTQLIFTAVPLDSLEALRGMPLSELACGPGALQDLSPLSGMPLTSFEATHNAISDLSPLVGMPLTTMNCEYNNISDLSPLRGAPLRSLMCGKNQINDLSPLVGMPLTQLFCEENRIADLRPLSALPLAMLDCSFNPLRDLSPLPSSTLIELLCAATELTSLDSVTHLSLSKLGCRRNHITDLAPLAAMPLTSLDCAGNPITHLTPLRGLPLTSLYTGAIPLHPENTAVISALPLQEWRCDALDPAALALIADHPTLQVINGHTRAHVLRVGSRRLLRRTGMEAQSG